MYIKLTNGQPETTSIGQLRRDNKNISFPKNIAEEMLNSYGTYSYTIDDKPSYNIRTQKIERGDFYQDADSLWRQGWNVANKTDAEIADYDAMMVTNVKKEAQRRIIAIIPEWKQRNLTARAAELAIKGVTNWTAEETAEHEAGQAVWDQVNTVREKSNLLETMTPIPTDYVDDKYWF